MDDDLTQDLPPTAKPPRRAKTKNAKQWTISINDIIKYAGKGLSTRDIGKLIGCTHQAVLYHLHKHNIDLDEFIAFRTQPDTAIELLQYRILRSLTDEDIVKVNAYQRIIAFAALDDKKRLHRGQATVSTNLLAEIAIRIDAQSRGVINIPVEDNQIMLNNPSSSEDGNDMCEPQSLQPVDI